MAAKEKAQDEKNLKILRELASQPVNRYCFDCQQRGPTYVNVTVGSFVCTTCSGILRGIHPPHRVKSITMTSFTADEMEQIKTKGNEYCKQVWLGKYDAATLQIESEYQNASTVKEFMVEKYENKKYYVEPEFAVKKPKARAPSIPSTTVTQSRSQTVIRTNTSSQSLQKPGWTSQNFPTAAESSVVDGTTTKESRKKSLPKQSKVEVESSSFADFGSAFENNVGPNQFADDFADSVPTSSQIQSVETESLNKSDGSQKKPAPPPPDRYAALADLDNELHQQQQQQQQQPQIIPVVMPDVAPVIWTTSAPSMGPIAFSNVAPQMNPFGHTMPPTPWSQAPANPFQGVPKPVPFQIVGNGGAITVETNGTVPGPFWSTAAPVSCAAWPFPSGQVDAFPNKYSVPTDHYNPWAQSLATESANPFSNGAGTSMPQQSSTNNPFL